MRGFYIAILGSLIFPLMSCQSNSEIKNALTFYSSFDKGANADFALGDATIYSAEARYENSNRILDDIREGIEDTKNELIKGAGLFGNAIRFDRTGSKVVFYMGEENIAYNSQDWSGTISFWLKVDPSTELDGYTDPIQITDTNFNDASIWVDFTDKAPRDFRLGVFGDNEKWTRDTLNMTSREAFAKRLVTVKAAAFKGDSWTHVAIAYKHLGTSESVASLYLNGVEQGNISGISDPFSWELSESKIFLGLNFNGYMDELAIFNQSFTDQQIMALFQLEGGIQSIL